MAMDTINLDGFRESVGKKLGVSDWLSIDQERITAFGEITSDMDPMHVDTDWSRKYSPYKTTVAFGFLTISLITYLYHDVLASTTTREGGINIIGLNYGFDRLRLIEPVPVDSRIRGHFTVTEVTDRSPNEIIVKLKVEIEVEGNDRMAVVAEWLTLLVDEEGSRQISEKQVKHA